MSVLLYRVRPELRELSRKPSGLRWYSRYVGIDDVMCSAAAEQRRHIEILAFTGENGGGKTAAAVFSILHTLRNPQRWECDDRGHLHTHHPDCPYVRYIKAAECGCEGRDSTRSGVRMVLANLPLYDPHTEVSYTEPHPLWRPWRRLAQIATDAEHCDVLGDEVTGIMGARQHGSLPVQIENLSQGLRKLDATFKWCTPDFGAADVRVRTITKAVVYCRGFKWRAADAAAGRTWREAQVVRWRLFDAAGFDEFTAGKRATIKPESTQFVYMPGHLITRYYNTLDQAFPLGAASVGGVCLTCDGGRSRPACSCPSDPSTLPPGVVETVNESGRRKRSVIGVVGQAQQALSV